MLRNGSTRLLVLVLLLTVFGTAGCSREQEEPRNLVLISLDTLRADHLGCYGYGRDTSPRLDALAGASVLFESAVSQANETVHSHRSLLTSAYPAQALMQRDRQGLAQILSDHGFATGGFTGGGPMSRDFGFDAGFDEFVDRGKRIEVKREQALQWLDGLPAETSSGKDRFFLFLHCFDIHAPYGPPEPYLSWFGADNPSTITPRDTVDLGRKIRRLHEFADFEGEVRLSDDDRQRMVDLYDGGIRYTDEMVGRFLDDLAERGLLENSVVVILADHGEEFWDHGSVFHGHTLYQELTHVPLIIHIPGFEPRRIVQRVALLDLLPTLLDIFGVEEPGAAFAGVSLMPLLRGESQARSGAPLISESVEPGHYSVIEDGYKLIRRFDPDRTELYRLDADSAEQDDLSLLEEERAGRMGELLKRHHEAIIELRRSSAPIAIPDHEDLDPRTVERLQELGYLEPDSPEDGSNISPSR